MPYIDHRDGMMPQRRLGDTAGYVPTLIGGGGNLYLKDGKNVIKVC